MELFYWNLQEKLVLKVGERHLCYCTAQKCHYL